MAKTRVCDINDFFTMTGGGVRRYHLEKLRYMARQDDVDAKTAALSRFVKAQHLEPIGPPSLAQYNPPWALWFLRRNEVMIPVSH